MSVSQISVFAESKPGHLVRVLEVFEKSQISVCGFSASDTGEYGILRFIVDDPERAYQDLHKEGFACVATPVLVLRLEDKPGELARVMEILAKCDINVIYSYSLISTYIALSTYDIEQAEYLLENEPVELLGQEEFSKTMKRFQEEG